MWKKVTRHRTLVFIALIVLALAVSASAIAMNPYNDDVTADQSTVESMHNPTAVASPTQVIIHQDATAAFEQDAALLATQAGMSVDEAEQIFSFQDAFAEFTEDYVFPRYEVQISAIWPDIKTSTGYIRFVGNVPDDVVSQAARRGLNVIVSDNGELSMEQQRTRSQLAAQALADAGYRPFITAPDFEHGVIKIEPNIPASEPVPNKTTIADLIAAEISTSQSGLVGRAAEIHPSDIDLYISITDEPKVTLDVESPLATWDPSQNSYFHAARGGEGPLVFEDSCVLVKNPNGSLILPIWPEPTSWDPDTGTINYISPVRNRQDENAVLHEGDVVELGGSSGPIEPSLLVRPPADHCVERADWTFIVSGIEVQPSN